MRFTTRLFGSAILLVILTASTLVLASDYWLRDVLTDALAVEMERETRLIARSVTNEVESLDDLADSFGELTSRRITFIDTLGVVVGDSDFDEPALSGLENHATRPEVLAAYELGLGQHLRVSASTGRAELKVAIESWPGIVRVSAPLTQIEDIVGTATRAIVFAAFVAVVIGTLLSAVFGRLFGGQVRQIALAARSLSTGRNPIFPTSSVPEIRELVRALRAMNSEVEQRMADLRKEREEQATLIDSMVEGVIAVDSRGEVTLCNESMLRLVNYSDDDELPNVRQLFRSPEAHTLINQVLDRQPVQGREVQIEGRPALVTGKPLPDGGAVFGVMDISELRRLEAVRRDFVANVSHELQTPLTSIMGYSETLVDDTIEDDVRKKFLGVIHRNAERMQNLVDDLLELARIEASEQEPQKEDLNVREIVAETLASFSQSAERRKVTLENNVTPGHSGCGDRDGLVRVISNLVDNALRYTEPEGVVEISSDVLGDFVEISVSDNGIGIIAEHIPRLFERFYRADPGRSREEGGTGLGLAICRHLVQKMGGEIRVESMVGKGTTFVFTVPSGQL